MTGGTSRLDDEERSARPLCEPARSIADPIWPHPTRTSVSAFEAASLFTGVYPALQASPIGSIIAAAIASSAAAAQITS